MNEERPRVKSRLAQQTLSVGSQFCYIRQNVTYTAEVSRITNQSVILKTNDPRDQELPRVVVNRLAKAMIVKNEWFKFKNPTEVKESSKVPKLTKSNVVHYLTMQGVPYGEIRKKFPSFKKTLIDPARYEIHHNLRDKQKITRIYEQFVKENGREPRDSDFK